LGENMGKKLFRSKADIVLRESKNQWLTGEELMYRTNQKLPGHASCNVNTVAYYMRLLKTKGLVEIRQTSKCKEYRWVGEN